MDINSSRASHMITMYVTFKAAGMADEVSPALSPTFPVTDAASNADRPKG